MKIGKSLAEQRKNFGFTQEELAESIGVSRQAVTKWENDESVPDVYKLMFISELFGISLDKLVGREDTMFDELRTVLDAYMQAPQSMADNENFINMAVRFMDYFSGLGLPAEQILEGLLFMIRGE